jgi:hypothetical protein
MEDKNKKTSEASGKPDETPIYLTGDSTLQTPEEDRKDKSNNPEENDKLEVSEDADDR